MVYVRSRQVERAGERLARSLLRGRRAAPTQTASVFGLVGELGAGKTTFVRGFARGLGIRRRITSPTFVLARRYRIPAAGRLQIAKRKAQIATKDNAKRYALSAMQYRWFWHFDCYRLRDEHDLAELGLHEILGDPYAIVAIEWADRIRRVIPKDALWIIFRHHSANTRELIFGRSASKLKTQK